MRKARHNMKLSVAEDLLLAATKVAQERQTSVDQLVRAYLIGLVEGSDRRRLARARLKRAFETGLVDVGERTWSRGDLHER
jgi:hypothetical protein